MRSRLFTLAVSVAIAIPVLAASNAQAGESPAEPSDVDGIPAVAEFDTELLRPLDELVRDDDDNAGRYIDFETNTVVYQFDTVDVVRDLAIEAAFPVDIGARLRIDVVAHDLNELRTAKNVLAADLGRGNIQGVGIDVENNGLYVLSTAEANTERARAAQLLSDVFDDIVPLTVDVGENDDQACNSRSDCGGSNARRGGVKLNAAGSSCTSGLNVFHGGQRYVMTAGHCWGGNTWSTVTTGGGQSFGTLSGAASFWYHNSWCDCRLVKPTSGATVSDRFYRNNSDKYQAISSAPNYVSVGDTVKMYGQFTQSTGSVSYLEYTYWSGSCGCEFKNSTLATYSNVNGDSGGTIASTSGTTVYGIQSGDSNGYGRFFENYNLTWTGASVIT